MSVSIVKIDIKIPDILRFSRQNYKLSGKSYNNYKLGLQK